MCSGQVIMTLRRFEDLLKVVNENNSEVYKSVLVALLLILNRYILFSLLTLNMSLSLP